MGEALNMNTINHDPDEPPRDRSGNAAYWASASIVAILWVIFLTLGKVDFYSVCLGAFTCLVVVGIAVEITGNRVPPWMR